LGAFGKEGKQKETLFHWFTPTPCNAFCGCNQPITSTLYNSTPQAASTYPLMRLDKDRHRQIDRILIIIRKKLKVPLTRLLSVAKKPHQPLDAFYAWPSTDN